MKKVVIALFMLLAVGCSSNPSYVSQANKMGVEAIKEYYASEDAVLTHIEYTRVDVKMKYYFYMPGEMLYVVFEVVIHYNSSGITGKRERIIEMPFMITPNGVIRY